jgi:hypothetical protein
MSFRSLFSRSKGSAGKGESSKRAGSGRSHRKQITMSEDHDHKQVIGFEDSSHDGTKAASIGRDLFSYPKPDAKETMADYINNHKSGDVFPYVTITGKEEETKDGRLARLRSFVSPYGKSVKPDMRINGIILDMLVGSIHIDDLKAHVDKARLSKSEARENKRFRDLEEHVFTKPYLQIKRITGEFVPLLSGTADYTDLMFSLHDQRLLEHQVVVQSNKLPTNSVGVFELSCDYCIPTKDIRQIAIRYELARPIMKEDFQWGSISLSISLSESDTPYLTPKVEAMAVVKAPYTAMEEQATDPDHKDVTYTSAQIRKFRDLYTEGDIADNDEPLKERLKTSSYSKSTIRGVKKGKKGPEHLGQMAGWSQLEGLKQPKLLDGEASVSVASGDDDDEEVGNQTGIKEWEEEQERMRKLVNEEKGKSVETKAIVKASSALRSLSPLRSAFKTKPYERVTSETDESEEPEIMKKMKKGKVGFSVEDV